MLSDKLPAPAPKNTSRPPLDERTVFVVDDDEAVLNSLRFSLEIEGFKVSLFRSGGDLLRQAEYPRSGCLVVDYSLLEMDGLEVLAALRKRGIALPAILTTSHPNQAVQRRAAADGVVVVEKPFPDNTLVEAIRRALGSDGP